MPRYNSISSSLTATGATSFSSPSAGIFTTLTGTSGYTVTLADPTIFTGESQSFYNATGGNVTLATVTGSIIGPGANNSSTITVPNNTVYTITSNGSNYVLSNNEGGAITGTSADLSGTVTITGTTNLNSTVNANPSNANISLSPTGTGSVTINPATAGAINNMSIGASTRGTGAFTTLSANNTTTLVNTTITPTQPPQATITQDGHGFILRAANYVGGQYDHRFVKPDMGGGIPLFVQQTTGTAGTWTNALRIGTFTGQSDMLYVFGNLGVQGTITESSSITIKEDINPIVNALESVLQLSGKIYTKIDTKQREAGLIAEDVYPVIPEVVTLDEHGNPKGIQYTKLAAYLIEAIKTLNDKIDNLNGDK